MKIRIIGEKGAIPNFIRDNDVVYIIILVVFLLGIIFGTIYYKNMLDEETTSKYLIETIDEIKETNVTEILQESLIKNIVIILAFWILGASIVGIPILMLYIAYKGFTLGFTISSFIATFGFLKGNIVSFTMLFFQNALIMSAIIISMTSGIKLAKNLVTKRKDVKIELVRHTIVCLICLVIMLFSSVVEALFNGVIIGHILGKF